MTNNNGWKDWIVQAAKCGLEMKCLTHQFPLLRTFMSDPGDSLELENFLEFDELQMLLRLIVINHLVYCCLLFLFIKRFPLISHWVSCAKVLLTTFIRNKRIARKKAFEVGTMDCDVASDTDFSAKKKFVIFFLRECLSWHLIHHVFLLFPPPSFGSENALKRCSRNDFQ